jgi:hypothetical protein
MGSGGTGRGSDTGVGGAGGRFASGVVVATGGGVGLAMGGAGFLQPAAAASINIVMKRMGCLCIVISAESLLGVRRSLFRYFDQCG